MTTHAAAAVKDAKRSAVNAALALAGDVAEGRLAPSAFDAAAVEACRDLLGAPAEPGDPLWGLRGDICRQHLAAGGIATNELAEWTAVGRQRDRDADCAPLIEPLGDDEGYMGVVTPVGLSDAAEGPSGLDTGNGFDAAVSPPPDSV